MRLKDIVIANVLQPRGDDLDTDVVAEYAARIKAGDKFPVMVAYKVTDREFKGPALVVGFHRYAAYKAAGVDDAEVEVREGTFAEAWLAGYLSNLSNGLRYTNAQKRAAVEQACLLFRDESANGLAGKLNVSHTFVQKVRDELVTLKKIEAPATVKTKDGRDYPAETKKRASATVADAQSKKNQPATVAGSDDDNPTARQPDKLSPARGGNNFDFGYNAVDDDEPEEPSQVDDPQPQILNTPKGEIVLDPYGRVVPNGIGDYFGSTTWQDIIEDIEQTISFVEELTDKIDRAARGKWLWIPGARLGNESKEIRNGLVKIANAIRDGLPYALCAHCEGKKCPKCNHAGYIPKCETQLEPKLYAEFARNQGAKRA